MSLRSFLPPLNLLRVQHLDRPRAGGIREAMRDPGDDDFLDLQAHSRSLGGGVCALAAPARHRRRR